MSAKDLLIALALPPFGFVTLAAVSLLLSGRYPRAGRAVTTLAVLGLIAFALPVVSGSLLVALETGLDASSLDAMAAAATPPAAIVILGGEITRTPTPPGAKVGPLTLERLRTGAELARKTNLPVLVTGGIVDLGKPAVGQLMARSMEEDFRVPVRWTEDQSRDTWENASYSAAILRAAGIRSVYVVTHAWHMKRALQSFASTELVVIPAPTPLDNTPTPVLADFVPRVSAWLAGYFAMHEWTGRAWYQLR